MQVFCATITIAIIAIVEMVAIVILGVAGTAEKCFRSCIPVGAIMYPSYESLLHFFKTSISVILLVVRRNNMLA